MFAYPFRQSSSGSIVSVDEQSDQGISQLIAAALLTRLGERQLFPTFGITDPTYGVIAGAQLAAVLSAYGPNVRIADLQSHFTDGHTQSVQVSYALQEVGVNAQS